MAEYVEYYFTGNPPLLPDGVASVIAHAREEFYPASPHPHHTEKLVEILYEPEAPWFKIIGPIDHQPEVLTKLQSCLEQMFDDQVGLVDDDNGEEDQNTKGEEGNCDRRYRADVEIIAETPQVIPWLKYLDGNWSMSDKYDEHRFPEMLDNFALKTVWRGLEMTNGLTIFQLLSRYSFLSPRALPPTVQDLGELTGCEITHNMRGDLIYIGSKTSPECLAAASQRLENLLGLHKPNITPSSHLIFPETIESHKLCIRWLTHVGLDKLTYTKSPLLGVVAESEPLSHAATVRIETAYKNGRKVEENTTYKVVENRSENFSPSFDPFVNFEYPSKCPGTLPKVLRPLPGSSSEFSENPDEDASEDSIEEDNVDLNDSLSINSDIGDQSLIPTVVGKGKAVATQDRQKDQTVSASINVQDADQGSVAASKTGSSHDSANILQASMTSTDVVTNWIAGIEAAHASASPGPGFPLSESSLDSESIPDPAPALQPCIDGGAAPQMGDLIPIESFNRPSTPNTEICDNTVCLLDSESPIKCNYGMFAALDLTSLGKNQISNSNPPFHESATVDEENLMDCWEAPISWRALMDIPTQGSDGCSSSACIPNTIVADTARQANDSFPVFNKRDDIEQDFRVTMNQKAGMSDAHANISFAAVNLMNVKGRPKLVPGVDAELAKPSRRALRNPEGMSRCVRDVERQVKEVLDVIQAVPGVIKIQAKLGRLCIKGVGDSLVNFGNGPSWRPGEILSALSNPEVEAEFNTILTTNGAEAESMPRLVLSKGEPWKLHRKDVYYDFVCGTKDNDDPIVVEVDAETFAYDCKPLCQDLPGVYIHCPRRAWDVQLSVTRFRDGAIPDDFQSYAEALVKSLGVSATGKGHVQINAGKDIVSRWHIGEVTIRHVAQYRSTAKSPTYLCISMTRAVNRQTKPGYQGTTTAAPVPGQGPMTQWFEAWFGSEKVDRYTRQNKLLQFGEKTSWTPEQLVNEGIVKGICEPALRMVTQMDQIGQTNYNGQGPQVGKKVSRAQTTFSKDEPFW